MENSSYQVLHLKPAIQKTTNQLNYVPRMIKTVPGTIQGTWYPTARPLQHYRKRGTNGSHTTDVSYSIPKNCVPCSHSCRVGTPFKMLGKKDNGKQKSVCCQPGNVISFSGNANIQSGSTDKPRIINGVRTPGYYFSHDVYLKRRGRSYLANSTFHEIAGIDYTKAPDGSKQDSSHYAQNIPTAPACSNITIYKPSNPSFSTQGPVDGSTHIARKKYNAITTNNSSFVKSWGVKMAYTEEPIFFQKNNYYVCTSANCE